jgi:ribosomal protein S11
MNDEKDRGGRTWACNLCIEKILYNNKIITITDNDGKILDLDYYK